MKFISATIAGLAALTNQNVQPVADPN